MLTMALYLGLSLTACGDKSQAQPHENPQQQTIVNTHEINKEVKDSLDKYTARIDSISKETKAAINKVNSMNTKVSNLSNNEKWWWSLGFVGIAALLIALYCIVRCVKLKERINRHSNKIQEIKDKLSVSFNQWPVSKAAIPSDYEALKRRIRNLETQIRQLTSTPLPTKPNTEIVVTPPITDVKKNGYFGTPIDNAHGPYFRKLLISCDSEARFVAQISGNKATFKPLDSPSYIGTIVSNDACVLQLNLRDALQRRLLQCR